MSFDARHLLRENRRHQRFEDRLRLGHAQARIATANIGEKRVGRAEAGVVVILPT